MDPTKIAAAVAALEALGEHLEKVDELTEVAAKAVRDARQGCHSGEIPLIDETATRLQTNAAAGGIWGHAFVAWSHAQRLRQMWAAAAERHR